MNADRYLRSFHVLGLLIGKEEGLRLTQIKDALQLPVSSVHNMLQTMVAGEVLSVTPDLRYMVGPRMVGTSINTVQALDIRSAARRPLQALAQSIGDDAYLGIRLGQRVVYADRAMGNRLVALDIRMGEALHLHSTATGKLFAANDPQLAARALAGQLPRHTANTITEPERLRREYQAILERGYATSVQEAMEGIVGYAVPVRQPDGTLAAAIHVSVIASKNGNAHAKKLIAAACDCAAQIERALGHFEPDRPRQHSARAGQSFPA